MKKEIQTLNSTVWATLAPSKGKGVGVFAIRDIPDGTKLSDNTLLQPARLIYYEFTEDELNQLLPEVRSLILDRIVYGEEERTIMFLSPNRDVFLQEFMNHSDEPNSLNMFSLRNIQKGEEITEDYRMLLRNPNKPHRITKEHMPFIWK